MLTEDLADRSDNEKLPLTGRLTPVGCSSESEYGKGTLENKGDELGKLQLLAEHEKLSAHLSALTRHFAHVQLRLQQVVGSSLEDREVCSAYILYLLSYSIYVHPFFSQHLLHELHEFASTGIPDIICQPSKYSQDINSEHLIEDEKNREREFINDLKQKLDELERYAQAAGSLDGCPTSVTIEKQKVLIDQLREKLDLQLDDVSVSKLSAEELRKLVDQGIHQLTNPVKLKENLIVQMRTQINDLESFVEFLKADSGNTVTSNTTDLAQNSSESAKLLNASLPTTTTMVNSKVLVKSNNTQTPTKPPPVTRQQPQQSSSNINTNFTQSFKKFVILTQLYTFLLVTCGTRNMQKKNASPSATVMKKGTIAKKHFGDLRAKLEIAIEKVLNVIRHSNSVMSRNNNYTDDDVSSTSSEEYENVRIVQLRSQKEEYDSEEVVLAVRQVLAPALQALMEHGLYEINYSTSLAAWGCFATRGGSVLYKDETMHVWKLFLRYYAMKHGNDFSNSPARKLSQSFSLDVIGGKPITLKQCLLSAIDTVVKLHEKHNKSMDSCFKAFICLALNEKKLVSFLRVLIKTIPLIENYYQSWSYTKTTGFNDALHALDRLTSIEFHLPVDISVRRFVNIKDLYE
ncbi:unnamed protein product [Didymodactylos carnosus]|uniref:RUN domain-containing protein n=1 Tax=Didymodactylos carnosus TaxID=1234261 RepID=A0A813YU92_9BILA|nr:unnamed protein product [Didymodactylos carnosus]CAF0889032.1 unnamed protein product [Didymodactylos carnosus]CAF3628545.1 unnamed protein product [Didymodactylos carnosus]CAF3673726.1 unnamed protein product [Didymodactylos carnosus]